MSYGAGRVRVFIGSTPATRIAAKVLECSIIRRTDMQVDFTHMHGQEWEYETSKLPGGCDAYVLRRWMIPAVVGYSGLAIYLDAASLVTYDIWDLWTKPLQTVRTGTIWCTYQDAKPDSGVMLIDCERAKDQWVFDIHAVAKFLGAKRKTHTLAAIQACAHTTQAPNRIEDSWLCRDYFQPGKTKLIHYPNTAAQPWPWLTGTHPFALPWEMELSIAIHAGFVPVEILTEALALWGTDDPRAMHPDYERFIPSRRTARRSQRKKVAS